MTIDGCAYVVNLLGVAPLVADLMISISQQKWAQAGKLRALQRCICLPDSQLRLFGQWAQRGFL